MPIQQIHCHLLEIRGSSWSDYLESNNIKSLFRLIHEQSLIGKHPNQYGFIGTTDLEDNLAGYFVVQYSAELLEINKKKEISTKTETPFEKFLFILFANHNLILLQYKKLSNIQLKMNQVLEKLETTFRKILFSNQSSCTLEIQEIEEIKISKEKFISEFHQSNKVFSLSVKEPLPELIPEDFVYYNPQFDKNKIIRQSHMHDYRNFNQVELRATETGDLKNTHIARDLVESGTPEKMHYFNENGEETVLHKKEKNNFEIPWDSQIQELEPEDIKRLKQILNSRLNSININIHFNSGNNLPPESNNQNQPRLFD